MKDFRSVEITHFVLLTVSFIVLFITLYNVGYERRNFDPVINANYITELLISHPDLKDLKTSNNTIVISVINRENIENLKNMPSKGVQIDEKVVGKYLFVYKDGYGIFDAYRNRIIFINNEYEVKIGVRE